MWLHLLYYSLRFFSLCRSFKWIRCFITSEIGAYKLTEMNQHERKFVLNASWNGMQRRNRALENASLFWNSFSRNSFIEMEWPSASNAKLIFFQWLISSQHIAASCSSNVYCIFIESWAYLFEYNVMNIIYQMVAFFCPLCCQSE